MSWRNRYRKAKFRNASFFVEDHSGTGGRRVVVHEFPDRDDPIVEDLGEKARQFNINAYLLGEDYDQDRDALLTAISERGPGTLIHPYLGRMTVQAGDFSITESKSDGGFCKIGIAFTRVGRATPLSSINIRKLLENTALGSMVQSSLDFSNGFVSAVSGIASDAVSIVRQCNEIADDLLSPIAALGESADIIASTISSVSRDVGTLINKPGQLAMGLQEPYTRLVDSADQARECIRAYGSAYKRIKAVVNYPVELIGLRPVEEKKNRDTLGFLICNTITASVAQIALNTDFDTYEDAIAVRQEILTQIETQQSDCQDFSANEQYRLLANLKSALIRSVPGNAELSRLQTYGIGKEIPLLAFLYSEFGFIDNFGEAISRNHIINPSLVVGELRLAGK